MMFKSRGRRKGKTIYGLNMAKILQPSISMYAVCNFATPYLKVLNMCEPSPGTAPSEIWYNPVDNFELYTYTHRHRFCYVNFAEMSSTMIC